MVSLPVGATTAATATGGAASAQPALPSQHFLRIALLAGIWALALTLTATANAHQPPTLTAHMAPWETARAICRTFGTQCKQAQRVAQCESTFRTRTWYTGTHARNGQYFGLFQVSRHWRETIPGYGPGAWAQARHARAVFNKVGRRWSPTWSCGYAA